MQGEPDVTLHVAGSSSVVTIDESSDTFCLYCYYLVRIRTEQGQQMQGFINVLLDDDAVWL